MKQGGPALDRLHHPPKTPLLRPLGPDKLCSAPTAWPFHPPYLKSLNGTFDHRSLRPPPAPSRSHLSASSSVTSFRRSRPAVAAELFRAPWLLLARFFGSFPKLLLSPSSVAALMRLLAGGRGRFMAPDPAPLVTPRAQLKGTGSCLGLGPGRRHRKPSGASKDCFDSLVPPQSHLLPHRACLMAPKVHRLLTFKKQKGLPSHRIPEPEGAAGKPVAVPD